MGATPIFQGVQSEGSGAYVRGYKQSVELDTGRTWPQRECYSSQRPQGRQRRGVWTQPLGWGDVRKELAGQGRPPRRAVGPLES